MALGVALRTRGIVTGIRGVPRRPERPKKAREHHDEVQSGSEQSTDVVKGQGPNGGTLDGGKDKTTDWSHGDGLRKGSEGARRVQSTLRS